MKIISHDLSLSSETTRERVWVNRTLQERTDPQGETAAPRATRRQLSSSEVRFHKQVVAEALTRIAGSIKDTFTTESSSLDMTERTEVSVPKGRWIDSDDPGLHAPGLGVLQERLTSIAKERLSFSAVGSVQTQQRQISIELDFSMSRNLLSDAEIVQRLKDPLVINYESDLAGLSEKRFMFDIDHDGLSDQISLLKKGSGFLALDRNGDGRINHGGELFGTESGDGFADLALFDQDQNGWIDENDAIFDQLRVWLKDDSGADRLVALGEVGVGAIFLSSADTLFNLTDSSNSETLGVLRQNGIFLRKNGDVGTVQNVDFAIRSGADMLAEAKEEEAAYAAMPDFRELAVKAKRPFASPDSIAEAQQDISMEKFDKQRAALQQQLMQLRSRLNQTQGDAEAQRISSRIARVKSELVAVETQALQQLFNTLA